MKILLFRGRVPATWQHGILDQRRCCGCGICVAHKYRRHAAPSDRGVCIKTVLPFDNELIITLNHEHALTEQVYNAVLSSIFS